MTVCALRMNRKMIYRKRQRAMKRKTMLKTALLFAAALITALISINAISTAFAKNAEEGITVTVSSGDTLWGIAQKYNPENKDIRSVINKILRANGMTDSNIRAGDTLVIPVN
ncbi:MAG: LysM peptidoglycan-binding domain-containing protein [Firmicutes bacterium]|nr:LysM peptidoglycan-binding domain-containing protein [Bacillota bacterium]